jgi:hypothetical protein
LLFLYNWLDILLSCIEDSADEMFPCLVGNHKVLFVKSLLSSPVPNNFLVCVIKNEFGTIDSVKSEFFTSQRCCLAISKLLSILKLKNIGYLSRFDIVFNSFKFVDILCILKLVLELKFA